MLGNGLIKLRAGGQAAENKDIEDFSQIQNQQLAEEIELYLEED